jgi:hypothetical protein
MESDGSCVSYFYEVLSSVGTGAGSTLQNQKIVPLSTASRLPLRPVDSYTKDTLECLPRVKAVSGVELSTHLHQMPR